MKRYEIVRISPLDELEIFGIWNKGITLFRL